MPPLTQNPVSAPAPGSGGPEDSMNTHVFRVFYWHEIPTRKPSCALSYNGLYLSPQPRPEAFTNYVIVSWLRSNCNAYGGKSYCIQIKYLKIKKNVSRLSHGSLFSCKSCREGQLRRSFLSHTLQREKAGSECFSRGVIFHLIRVLQYVMKNMKLTAASVKERSAAEQEVWSNRVHTTKFFHLLRTISMTMYVGGSALEATSSQHRGVQGKLPG